MLLDNNVTYLSRKTFRGTAKVEDNLSFIKANQRTIVCIYIQRGEDRAKLLNRLARDKKMAELYAELKSQTAINESVRLFYQNFDTAFLNIYPNFITDVNVLMTPDNQFETEGAQKLTTELRVLALLRLGIADNQKIADILRSSITTIYTYRSKFKARAVNKDSFEDEVRRIATY